MAPGYTNKLAGFPIFGVASVKDRKVEDEENENHCLPLTSILVVGGGGAARTGIKNCISVYEIEENAQGLGEAKNTIQHETASEVCTSIDVSPTGRLVACSMGDSCGVFSYRKFTSDEIKANKEKRLAAEAKKKKKTLGEPVDNVGEFEMVLKWTTDKPLDENTPACQNVVKFGCSDNLVATGGDDCFVHVWEINKGNNIDNEDDSCDKEKKKEKKEETEQEWTVNRLYKLAGHSKEIRDLDFDPSGTFLASASKDQGCRIWDIKTGKLAQLLPADTTSGLTYRRCKFSSPTELITLQIPNGGRGSSNIVVWRSNKEGIGGVWSVAQVVAVSKGMATSFYLTRDGKYVGLAAADGSVSLLDRKTFNPLRKFNEVHNLPITGLCSAYCVEHTKNSASTSSQKEYLLSGSIDRIVSVVPVQHSHLKWILLRLLLTLLLVLSIFALVSKLFPAPDQETDSYLQKEL